MAKEPEPPQSDPAGAPDDIDGLTSPLQGGPTPPPPQPASDEIYGHDD